MRGIIVVARLIGSVMSFATAEVSITKSAAGWELSNGHIVSI